MSEETQFKSYIYGTYLPKLEYKIYEPMDYYILLGGCSFDKTRMMTMSQYKEIGGHWLVEFTDDELTNSWNFQFVRQAMYWKREKEKTRGEVKIIHPDYIRM